MKTSQSFVRVVILTICAALVTPTHVWGQVNPRGIAIKSPARSAVATCNQGADPVDPTFKWVPPTSWRLIKTDSPQLVTQTSGSGKETTCLLPPGTVVGYPPDGGRPVVVLCKNLLVAGRPTGTEIPRGIDTVSMVAAQRAAMNDTVVVKHTGAVTLAWQAPPTDLPRVPIVEDYKVPGRANWWKRGTIAALIAGTSYGIYAIASQGNGKDTAPTTGRPPGGRTGPAFQISF